MDVLFQSWVPELGGVAAGGRVEALACERLGLGEAR